MYFILLIDNCIAHRGIDKKNVRSDHGIPEKLIVILILPNVTSHCQLMYMGIIVCFKVGYRVQLLEYLL